MLEAHPDIETPESLTSIWRYMSIDKLLSLLTSSSLWFSSCDYFEDGWEGHFSPPTYETFLKSFKGLDDKIQALWKSQKDRNQEVRNCLYINCWHINEEESAALWQIYSCYGKSVAIKTTIHRLRDALEETELSIQGGRVRYADYTTEPMPVLHNLFLPFLRKRRSFSFENEFRLIYWNSSQMLNGNASKSTCFPSGLSVPIKLDPLIEKVYLSPRADSYILDALVGLLQRLGLSRVKVIQSELFNGPV